MVFDKVDSKKNDINLYVCIFYSGNPCAMASIMDLIEPERVQSGKSPLCPTLFHSSNPKSFKRVFANDVYVILKV